MKRLDGQTGTTDSEFAESNTSFLDKHNCYLSKADPLFFGLIAALVGLVLFLLTLS